MTSASYYTIAGGGGQLCAVISNLEMAIGDSSQKKTTSKEKVCVLGATVAKEILAAPMMLMTV